MFLETILAQHLGERDQQLLSVYQSAAPFAVTPLWTAVSAQPTTSMLLTMMLRSNTRQPNRNAGQPDKRTCYNCRQVGHISRFCPQRQEAGSAQRNDSATEPSDTSAWTGAAFPTGSPVRPATSDTDVFAIYSVGSSQPSQLWSADAVLPGTENCVSALIDSGAALSVI